MSNANLYAFVLCVERNSNSDRPKFEQWKKAVNFSFGCRSRFVLAEPFNESKSRTFMKARKIHPNSQTISMDQSRSAHFPWKNGNPPSVFSIVDWNFLINCMLCFIYFLFTVEQVELSKIRLSMKSIAISVNLIAYKNMTQME